MKVDRDRQLHQFSATSAVGVPLTKVGNLSLPVESLNREEHPRMPIRALIFDLGNVLVLFSHEQMFSQIAAACGASPEQIREILLERRLQARYERGELSEAGFHQALETALGQKVDIHALRLAGADIFRLNEPLIPILAQFKSCGYRLVLLSNTCITHYDWIRERFDFLDQFDELVLSYQVGAVKPEDAIYHAAVKASRCRPSECFYTDDIPAYVERARELGLEAEVFTDVPSLSRHLRERGIG